MEDKHVSFDITDEGVALLGQILESAIDMAAPGFDPDGSDELSEDQQELVVSTAGAILVEVIRLATEAEED